jgi:hypothetical protein
MTDLNSQADTVISPSEIETFAMRIAEPDFDLSTIETLIGHLPERYFDAVIDRAAEIARGEAAIAEADDLTSLNQLARAGVRHEPPRTPGFCQFNPA